MPNRAERRSIEDANRRYVELLNKGSDATRPLVYRAGYKHAVCGGDVEVANNRAIGAFCQACDSHIPRRDTRLETREEREARLAGQNYA